MFQTNINNISMIRPVLNNTYAITGNTAIPEICHIMSDKNSYKIDFHYQLIITIIITRVWVDTLGIMEPMMVEISTSGFWR